MQQWAPAENLFYHNVRQLFSSSYHYYINQLTYSAPNGFITLDICCRQTTKHFACKSQYTICRHFTCQTPEQIFREMKCLNENMKESVRHPCIYTHRTHTGGRGGRWAGTIREIVSDSARIGSIFPHLLSCLLILCSFSLLSFFVCWLIVAMSGRQGRVRNGQLIVWWQKN